jgi:hypothetical protein
MRSMQRELKKQREDVNVYAFLPAFDAACLMDLKGFEWIAGRDSNSS